MKRESTDSRRIIVIPRQRDLLPWSIRMEAFCHGVIASLFLTAGVLLWSFGLASTILWTCALLPLFGWPIWRISRSFTLIATLNRAFQLGLRYGTGLGAVPLAISLYFVYTEWRQYFEISVLVFMPFLAFIVLSFISLLTGLAFEITMKLMRLVLPILVVQDGTMCPACSHCLLGAASMRCPECGREFSYEEIETTEEQFRKRTVDAFQRTC